MKPKVSPLGKFKHAAVSVDSIPCAKEPNQIYISMNEIANFRRKNGEFYIDRMVLQAEDDFGMKDSDWDVYKKIARDAEDSDSEEESLKAQVAIRLQIDVV
mgnify:CR=1 FL=1